MAEKRKWTLEHDKYMSKAEVDKLRQVTRERAEMDLARGRKNWMKKWMLIDLATRSGLRVAEMADLKVKDIKIWGQPTIRVLKGKGGKKRDVIVDNELKKHLKEYIKTSDLGEDDYLITSNKGGRCNTRTLQKHFKSACEVAGLPSHYSIHACRHTFAVGHPL